MHDVSVILCPTAILFHVLFGLKRPPSRGAALCRQPVGSRLQRYGFSRKETNVSGTIFCFFLRDFVWESVSLCLDYIKRTFPMGTNYIDELNEGQRAAVHYTDGPSLVIAGAGSGKTRVLTYKIAYLLEQGLAPWSILALTFTNKAAREMQERIARQVGGQTASRLWMGTFHSIFARILRAEADRIGFTSRFTIYDASDSKSLIKSIIKEMKLDDKVYRPGLIQAHISAAKNRLLLPDAYGSSRSIVAADAANRVPLTGEIYRRYWLRCRQADVMDFDDLLVYTFLLLHHHPDVCRRYEERFQFVLVDEYQDTNYAQHCIVWELTRTRRRICVVGDDAQSIYSFRGANIDNILNFQRQYEGARLFKLEQNYRSTQTIVGAANSLIEHNKSQIPKDVFSQKPVGEPITVYAAYSDLEEAGYVVKEVARMHDHKQMSFSDMAVLYRTNAQSRVFEEALRQRGIPYRIYGGLSFYQRKEIKDTIAYFRLAVNPDDEEALKRVINYPARGIGQTTVDKLMVAASDKGVSLWRVVNDPEGHALAVNRGTLGKLAQFAQLITGFMADAEQMDAAALGKHIVLASGIYQDIHADRSPENLSRQENVQELLNSLQEFVAARQEEGGTDRVPMADFLQEVALWTDQDEKDEEGDADKLTLMTVHAAKGLEFKAVFVVGLEEELFPNAMAGGSVREMEEERRLFYVALTRAEDYCYLSFARSRYRYGKLEFGNPSRFLREIDSRYLRLVQSDSAVTGAGSGAGAHPLRSSWSAVRPEWDAEEAPRRLSVPPVVAPVPRTLRRVSPSETPSAAVGAASDAPVRAGQFIEHERFGRGRVVTVEGRGENAKATVEFQNAGTKQLLLRFARFKVVD